MINRNVGPTLTNATYDQLADCVSLGGYPVIKVVTGWGLRNGQGQPESWNDTNRRNVCNLTRWTIVRTKTGDKNWIDESKVADELRPWYVAKKASRWGVNPAPGYSNLHIELGNEPNLHDPFDCEQFIWDTRWHLLRAIDVCRELNLECSRFD